jgi:thiol-disulfide isomerase/thioredoxin
MLHRWKVFKPHWQTITGEGRFATMFNSVIGQITSMNLSLFMLLLVVFGLGCTTATSSNHSEQPNALVATEPAIDSSSYEPSVQVFEQFADLEYIFRQQNDTTYVINFWATWCKPCVAEMPYFEELDRKYSDQKVKTLLVSLDFRKEVESKVKPFMRARLLRPDVLLLADPDANSWIPKVAEAWDGAIPVTLVYRGAEAKFFETEFENYEQLENLVKSFL